ncbi:polynucleotide adenylyltransferase PcnB [Moraxella lacunata]|nr:polynucleotide adenylyltransferase PcnB [Moraxella lacunata]
MQKKPTKHKTPKSSATVLSAQKLGLDKRTLPHSIVEVISTLNKAGFNAYIVGGGVRDSLLGLTPKDFDAVTNARPHEIKAVFGGRCRIIGKRFLLAHVYSGRELIEVATFRAPPKDDTHTTDDGMITRDNAWGTIEQDFARRDFSINALYYQPIKGEVLDFCGAVDDIKNGTLRLLGNAKVRIEEDPVRLLRALRFKAKLGFEFDKALAKQFNEDNWALLEQVSAHRLYDETQKMFTGGYLAPLLPLLYQYGAIEHLINHAGNEPTRLALAFAQNTDERIHDGKTANPAFFYAVLLWENYLHALAKFKKKGLPFHEAQIKASRKVFDAQRNKTAIPKFAEEFIEGIWLMQPRLTAPKGKEIDRLISSPKFRASIDFLVMREHYDDNPLSEPTDGMGAWWQRYLAVDATSQSQMLSALGGGVTRTRRRRGADKGIDKDAELLQLQQLSGRDDDKADDVPQPLLVVDNANTPKSTRPTPRARQVDVPTFERRAYSESDFAKLLDNDEPYIPSVRYRKRQPSSTLSIKEREQGVSEHDIPTPKKAKSPKPKTKHKDKPIDHKDKPKKRKKSNAKPRAKHDD